MRQQIVNTPIAGTFRWLYAGGTVIKAPERERESCISLREGEERTVILEDDAEAAIVRADLATDSALHLIQIRRSGDTVRDLSRIRRREETVRDLTRADIRVRCGENARFHWYRVVLGGAATYDNCSVELAGEGSSFTADIGYRLGGSSRYDANCEAIHTGRMTESAIFVSGVLAQRAYKLLRTTIDLRKGCKGAAGKENENVLLLDDTVQNLSVPSILCTEEDVAGDHGASIGQPDEELLYYMASRGIDAEEARRMLAQAMIDAVIGRIPDPRVREQLLGREEAER